MHLTKWSKSSSIGLQSGLCDGQTIFWRTCWRCLDWTIFLHRFAVCFASLSCCRMNPGTIRWVPVGIACSTRHVVVSFEVHRLIVAGIQAANMHWPTAQRIKRRLLKPNISNFDLSVKSTLSYDHGYDPFVPSLDFSYYYSTV